MKFRIGVIILFIFVAFPSVAQDFEIVPLGQMSPGTRMTFGVDPDDMGRAVGRVVTCDGKAVEGAVAVIYDGLHFYGAKSKKDGAYDVGANFGVHVIEVVAPGYRKYRGEADIPKGRDTNLDIVLEPFFDGIADLKPQNNRVSCQGNTLTMSVNAKHPAYKGKSMLDVLLDVPMLTIVDGKFVVANNEKLEFFLNGNPFRAPFAAALNFFGSIDAAKVKSVRIMTMGGGNTTWVSISYSE